MNHTSIKLFLPNDVIVGCMDFAGESQIDLAMVNTLTAFVNLMKARGKIPDHTPEECDQLVELHTRTDRGDADMFEDIESFLPPKPTVSDIAAEVERRIHSTAIPQIAKPVGDIGEPQPIEKEKVNLYEIPRELTLDKLKKMAPKDRLIELAVAIERDIALGKPMADNERLIIPAIEIVYSSTIQSDWGSAYVEKKISSLIQMHGTTAE